jgi:hypothetical protein
MRIPAAGAAAVGLSVLLGAGRSRAQGAAEAEKLFQEGKKLLGEKRFDEACPKLAESYRIDPATGTLLAAALCYEGQGKTASAWKAYVEVAVRASRERSAEREQAAHERARELEPRLGRLKLDVDPAASAAGVSVEIDGAPVAKTSFGTAIPVDPGEHAVDARAPGKRPFSSRVRFGSEGGTQTVAIGALADLAVAPPPPRPAPPFFTPLRVAGLAIGGVGLVGLGAGAGLTARALAKKSESALDCTGNLCGQAGFDARNAARAAGNGATAAWVVGGVLAGAGLTLFLVRRPSPPAAAIELSGSPAFAALRLGGTLP